MSLRKFGAVAFGVASVLLSSSMGFAKPKAPAEFCAVYPDAPACASGLVTCDMCHTVSPAHNLYGAMLDQFWTGEMRPLSDEAFTESLEDALRSVETQDADGDGVSNLDELMAGTDLSDATSAPGVAMDCPEGPLDQFWDVCNYDAAYVFKKVLLDFCGFPPSRSELRDFRLSDDPRETLRETLDECLDSEFWMGREGVVWNMANTKILPVASIKSGEDSPGDIPLADYLDDYNLFVYAHTDNRDAREVLTANYFVERKDGTPTTYTTFDRSPVEDYQTRGFGGAQLVGKAFRAGLLTHRWFLMSNTMFTGVPRTTAAQAYRAYLGYDISRLEGLEDVPGEPKDYDSKGVQAQECARCHATLDPLSYPFSTYEGIGGGYNDAIPFSYNSGRMGGFVNVDGPRVAETPEAGVIFGQEVANLRQWADVAANSDAYARATVEDYWELLMGEAPRGSDTEAFTTLWQDFKGKHEYGVERMLHDLIMTEAYGVP